jgi:riboflavin kinase/FMN adenylyltransferase
MLIARQLPELPPSPRGTCVALGMFDGVHLGHQHVIRAALLDAAHFGARSVALTFDPHPLAVVNPARAPRLLQTVPQRLRAIAALGCWATVVVPFTAEFAARSGEDFVRELARGIGCAPSASAKASASATGAAATCPYSSNSASNWATPPTPPLR